MYADDIVISSHDKNLEIAISTINGALSVLSDSLLQSQFVTAPKKSQCMPKIPCCT